MSEFQGETVDLFGFPVSAPRKPGRPAHVRSQEIANKISLMFACGYEVKEVAEVIGISQPTLRRAYFSEVKGRLLAKRRLRVRAIERLNAQAEAGNVAAEKALLGFLEREEAKALSDRQIAKAQAATREQAAPKLGKKAEAVEAAKSADGLFAQRPAPGTALTA